DRVERILRDCFEAEPLSNELTIDREGRASQRTGTERQAVDAAARIEQALAVAFEKLDIGQQVMADRHRLRDLQVGETRHHGVHVSFRRVHQRTLERAQRSVDAVDLAPQPEAEISRDLISARSTRRQPLAGVADEFGQPLLDVQVYVLELEAPHEFAPLDFNPNLSES